MYLHQSKCMMALAWNLLNRVFLILLGISSSYFHPNRYIMYCFIWPLNCCLYCLGHTWDDGSLASCLGAFSRWGTVSIPYAPYEGAGNKPLVETSWLMLCPSQVASGNKQLLRQASRPSQEAAACPPSASQPVPLEASLLGTLDRQGCQLAGW